MRDGFQVKRYLRSLVDGKSKVHKPRVRKPRLPFAEGLEERRLLTLSV